MAGLCGCLSLAVAERQQSDILQTLINRNHRSALGRTEPFSYPKYLFTASGCFSSISRDRLESACVAALHWNKLYSHALASQNRMTAPAVTDFDGNKVAVADKRQQSEYAEFLVH